MMMMRRHSAFSAVASAVLVLALASFLPSPTTAFKEQDFKKCATSSFCARHRDRPDNATATIYKVEGNGKFAWDKGGADAVATLTKSGEATQLALKLTCYADGVVRVHIEEPKKPRYAVPEAGPYTSTPLQLNLRYFVLWSFVTETTLTSSLIPQKVLLKLS